MSTHQISWGLFSTKISWDPHTMKSYCKNVNEYVIFIVRKKKILLELYCHPVVYWAFSEMMAFLIIFQLLSIFSLIKEKETLIGIVQLEQCLEGKGLY